MGGVKWVWQCGQCGTGRGEVRRQYRVERGGQVGVSGEGWAEKGQTRVGGTGQDRWDRAG